MKLKNISSQIILALSELFRYKTLMLIFIFNQVLAEENVRNPSSENESPSEKQSSEVIIETKEQFCERLKQGVTSLKNGDVFINMKKDDDLNVLPAFSDCRKYLDNLKGSGFSRIQHIFLLNIDPNLDVKQFVKDIKTTNGFWIDGAKQYFKRKRFKFEEVKPNIRNIKTYIDSGAIILAPLPTTGKKTWDSLLERLEKRSAETDINNWIKTLKTFKPISNLNDLINIDLRISYIGGYNEKSKELFVFCIQNKEGVWITEAEFAKLSKGCTHYSLDVN